MWDPKQEASHGVPSYITWFLDHGNKLPIERIKRKKCCSLPFVVGRFYSPISGGLRNSPVALSIIIFTQNPEGEITEEIVLKLNAFKWLSMTKCSLLSLSSI